MQSSRTVAANKRRRILAEVRTLVATIKHAEQSNYPPALLNATRAEFHAKVKKY
jgi:hypothetical protein